MGVDGSKAPGVLLSSTVTYAEFAVSSGLVENDLGHEGETTDGFVRPKRRRHRRRAKHPSNVHNGASSHLAAGTHFFVAQRGSSKSRPALRAGPPAACMFVIALDDQTSCVVLNV